ncbi:TPA: hypothetical protein QHO06_004937 [Escherichia coli]|nr:hypothetical protein [Escherichia coli]HDT4535728.1 hypothetical protein [Escherichia coli]
MEGAKNAYRGSQEVRRADTPNQGLSGPTVQIKDGQTLLLGGLIDSNTTDGNRSVPWFESVPVIGWLFRSHSDSHNERTMFVLLTAHVIKAL